MTEISVLRSWVRALLEETEAGPSFDDAAITEDILARYGSVPPDPIPDFWAIADRHRPVEPPSGNDALFDSHRPDGRVVAERVDRTPLPDGP